MSINQCVVTIHNQQELDLFNQVAEDNGYKPLTSFLSIVNRNPMYYFFGFYARLKENGKIGFTSLQYFDFPVGVSHVSLDYFIGEFGQYPDVDDVNEEEEEYNSQRITTTTDGNFLPYTITNYNMFDLLGRRINTPDGRVSEIEEIGFNNSQRLLLNGLVYEKVFHNISYEHNGLPVGYADVNTLNSDNLDWILADEFEEDGLTLIDSFKIERFDNE